MKFMNPRARFGWMLSALWLSGAATAPWLSSFAQAEDMKNSTLQARAEFLSKVHKTNQLEIQLGNLAMKKGESAKVREFGQRLVKDHGDADRKVMELAKQEGLKIQELSPSEDEKLLMSKLQRSNGSAFDQAFAQGMDLGHENAMKLLRSAYQNDKDAKLQGLLEDIYPKIKEHHETAINLETTGHKG